MDANCLTSTIIHVGDELYVPRPRPTAIPPRTPKPTVEAPVIATFTLDPHDEIVLGDCVQLSWVVQGVIEKISLTADSHTLVSDALEIGDYSDCPTKAGTRQYVLKAEGPDKNSYETGQITVIDDSVPPVATFTYACTDLSCTFDGSGSNDPDGTIVSYEWDFGDGATGNGATASHTYASSGTYSVSLTVTDDGSDTGTDSQNVAVSGGVENQPPVASFTYTCTDLSCTFNGSGSYDSDGTIVSYQWVFGDGGTGSGATTSHGYGVGGTYNVSLTVTDDEGDTGTDSQKITVSGGVENQSPVASFTYTCTDLSCTFDGSGSYDSDGTIVSYQWVFGDGETGSGATTSHGYGAGGTYNVSLTVTDDGGDTDVVSKSVAVSASDGAESSGFVSFSISVTPRTTTLMRAQDQPLLT
jgi:PKD repeat protein